MERLIYFLCKLDKIRFYNIKKSIKAYSSCSQSANIFIDYNIKYTEEQQTKIFKFLNESTSENILKLMSSQQRLKRLLTRRKNIGHFKSFQDILDIDGFSIKTMEKVCDSILGFDSNINVVISAETLKKKAKSQTLMPAVSRSKLNAIQSATSIHITSNVIAWSKIEKSNFDLTDWNLFKIENDNSKKLQIPEITDICWKTINMLPKSDVYIMEALPTVLKSVGSDAKNPKSFHVNLQRAQLISILSAMINLEGNIHNLKNVSNRESEVDILDHKILFMRPTMTPRLFKIIVGNERVSAETTVDNIIKQNTTEVFDYMHKLNVPDFLQSQYYGEKDVEREILSQTLLIALTFYEVIVEKEIEKLVNNE